MKQILFLSLFIASLLLTSTGEVYAASAAWQNASQINYSGKEYIAPPLDITFGNPITYKSPKYYLGGKVEDCVNHIRKISSDKKTGELVTYTGRTSGRCRGEAKTIITLINPNKSKIFLKWQDSLTITTTDRKITYKQTSTIDGGRTRIFTRQGLKCPDAISIGSSLSSASYKIVKTVNGTVCQTERVARLTVGSTSAASKTPTGGAVGNTQVNNTGFSGGGSGSSSGTSSGSGSSGTGAAAAVDPCDPANLKKDATATPEERGAGCSIESSINACYDKAGYMSFILCPIINLAADGIQHLINLTEELLVVNPLSQDIDDPIYVLWKSFRDLANVAFVLVFMVIIFANTLSLNIDAYTIKKLLPKLVAATILVQFSYFLSALVIDFGNVLGQGIGAIVSAVPLPVTQNASVSSLGTAAQIGLFMIVPVIITLLLISAFALIPTIILMAGVAFISLLGVFVSIAARKLILMVLVVVSPLAVVAWVLPNTSKYYKLWWSNFIKLVMMYPLIILILNVAGIVSVAARGTGTNDPVSIDIAIKDVNNILAGIIPIIAFFSIPKTFKMSGNLMNSISGAVMNQSRKYAKNLRTGDTAERVRKDRQAKMQEAAAGMRFGEGERVLGIKLGAKGANRLNKVFKKGAYVTRGGFFGAEAYNAQVGKGFHQAIAHAEDLKEHLPESGSDVLNDAIFWKNINGGGLDTKTGEFSHGLTEEEAKARGLSYKKGLVQMGREDLIGLTKSKAGRIAALRKRGEVDGINEAHILQLQRETPAHQLGDIMGSIYTGKGMPTTLAKNRVAALTRVVNGEPVPPKHSTISNMLSADALLDLTGEGIEVVGRRHKDETWEEGEPVRSYLETMNKDAVIQAFSDSRLLRKADPGKLVEWWQQANTAENKDTEIAKIIRSMDAVREAAITAGKVSRDEIEPKPIIETDDGKEFGKIDGKYTSQDILGALGGGGSST